MVKFTFDLKDELHSKFKSYCASKKVSMKDSLTLAITIILKKWKKTK